MAPPAQDNSAGSPDPTAGAVLVGVDGTHLDSRLLIAAVGEAARRGLPLHVRHCREEVDPAGLAGVGALDRAAFERLAGADELLASRVSMAAELDDSLTVTADQPVGRPENLLVSASAAASLVVIGTGRKSRLEELVLGTVALTVAAHARCPVLVVPQDVEPDRDGDVVVGVDGSEDSAEALAVAVEEARLRGARLIVVTTWNVEVVGGYVVTEPESEEWRQVEDRIRRMQEHLLAPVATDGVRVDLRAIKGGIRSTLAEATRDAALVVVGNRGRGGFKSKALGSVTMDLMKRAHSPVLVVHAPR